MGVWPDGSVPVVLHAQRSATTAQHTAVRPLRSGSVRVPVQLLQGQLRGLRQYDIVQEISCRLLSGQRFPGADAQAQPTVLSAQAAAHRRQDVLSGLRLTVFLTLSLYI